MKTTKRQQLTLALLLLVGLTFSSACKKNEDKRIPPTINFKTTGGYTYADCTLTTDDTISVGITAAFAEGKDYLTRFVIGQTYDGAATATTWYQETMNTENYSHDATIITRSIAGFEKYTFTIINRDGLVTTLTLNLTVI